MVDKDVWTLRHNFAPAALRQLFGYIEQPNFPSRYNVAPTQPIPVVLHRERRAPFPLDALGIVAGLGQGSQGIYAPDQRPLRDGAGKARLQERDSKRRRGLIPADGYYEWKTEGGRKQPFFIHRADGEPLGFAAVFETWVGPNGEELDTVAIVTAAAGEDLAALHDRVPVTISPRDFERWLDSRGDDVDAVLPLMSARASANSPGTRSPPASTASPMTTTQFVLPISAEESRGGGAEAEEGRAEGRSRSADDGQGSLF